LEHPVEIELNKSSYSCKFKNPGMLFFWIDQEELKALQHKSASKTNLKITMEKTLKIGIGLAPIIWFDDIHCIFGWICGSNTSIFDLLNSKNPKIPSEAGLLELTFSKDASTIF
jgi:hypothetical protein